MQKKLLLVFLVICFQALLSFGQGTSGKIVGTVSTADGAVPGATIVITDNQTAKERTVVSSSEGTFEVSQLEFGTYTVKITASGYKTFVASDVKIDAGREYPLNALLEAGNITEQVTITAGAEQINSSNGELSTTISTEQIRELPLNGRNPLSLLNLTAGASPTSGSINGQRTSATTITRDGLNVQDNFIRTGTFVSDQPSVDDISEITITTQNAGVEQGAGASFVQLVTPRGGNKFHGNLFAFNRNSKFTANSFFNNANNLARPFLNRNQFGGTLSGPVPLPGFNEGGPAFVKNKAFFFFNYEGFRLAQQATINGLNTLLPAARDGSFTFSTTGGTRTVNVLTGQGFTSQITPVQGGVLSVDPIIQARYLANLPTAANGVTTGTNYTQTLSLLRADPLIRNAYAGRFDVDFNDRNSFNAVYKRNNASDARTDQAAGFSPNAFVTQGGPTNFFAAAYRTTISDNFSNEVRGGFQKSEPFFRESNVPTNYLISTTGGLALTNPEGTFRSQGRTTKYRNIQDNAVYSWGNHSLRFGGSVDLYGFQSLNFAGTTPTYTIATSANTAIDPITATQVCGSQTCINATDLARLVNLRYFLGGIVGAAEVTTNIIDPATGYGFGPSNQRLNYEIYSAYGSDQWRVNKNLTLNFGLRYELFTPLNSPQALYLEPVIQNNDLAGSILNPNGFLDIVGTNSGERGNFFNADKNNFAPNFSFAYSPNLENGLFSKLIGRSTVIRGGFSVNYFNDEYTKSSSTLAAGNAGLGALRVQGLRGASTVLATSLSSLSAFAPLPTFSTPPSFTAPPRSFLFNNQQAGLVSQVFGTDPNIQVPRVYQWNIGIQREIGFKTVVEARYVGNLSNDLIRTVDFNQVNVNNNGFLADVYRAQSNLAIVDAERTRLTNECLAGGGTSAACATQVNTARPRTAAFVPALSGLGSQQ
ncbi:MAG TPA: TonB-dependent receptor, partial [Pyrinomonadaceae bacterium]|nr:TonB-dependent receptor [Pyrinomonadaceae bacterium]